jgi:hypothetical protein
MSDDASNRESLRRAIRDALSGALRVPSSRILYEVSVSPYTPTGETRHYVGGLPMAKPYSLTIVKFEGDAGFYLVYLDEAGLQMTDTYHESEDGAFSQAEFEFGIPRTAWKAASPNEPRKKD